MSGLFDVIGLGGNALQTNQAGLHVTGRNITQAGMPGYVRETPQFNAVSGGGATLAQTERRFDASLFGNVSRQAASFAAGTARADVLSQLEGKLESIDMIGALDGFFNAWRDLGDAPDSNVARQEVVSRADFLGQRFRAASATISESREALDREVGDLVQVVNKRLERVADLNAAIKVAARNGDPALNDMINSRDVELEKLASEVGAQFEFKLDGTVSVRVGDVYLVDDGTTRPLTTEGNSDTGMLEVRVSGAGRPPLGNLTKEGRLASLMELRDVQLPNVQKRLDDLAFRLMQDVNALHAEGFGRDGLNGRTFFDLPDTSEGAAGRVAVRAELLQNHDQIAAAGNVAAASGDGDSALALAALNGDSEGTLIGDAIDMLSSLGHEVRRGKDDAQTAQERLALAESLREQHQGVNVEEELVTMMRYQRAYQFAARLVRSADEMLQTLMR